MDHSSSKDNQSLVSKFSESAKTSDHSSLVNVITLSDIHHSLEHLHQLIQGEGERLESSLKNFLPKVHLVWKEKVKPAFLALAVSFLNALDNPDIIESFKEDFIRFVSGEEGALMTCQDILKLFTKVAENVIITFANDQLSGHPEQASVSDLKDAAYQFFMAFKDPILNTLNSFLHKELGEKHPFIDVLAQGALKKMLVFLGHYSSSQSNITTVSLK